MAIRIGQRNSVLVLGLIWLTFKFDYSQKRIDISKVPFIKKAFRVAHTRMEYDPAVWAKVEELILDTINKLR